MAVVTVQHLKQKVMLVMAALDAGGPGLAASALVDAALREAGRLAAHAEGSKEAGELAALGLGPGKDMQLFQSAATGHLGQNMQKWVTRTKGMHPRSYNLFFKAVLYALCRDSARLPLARQRSCSFAQFRSQLAAEHLARAGLEHSGEAAPPPAHVLAEFDVAGAMEPVGCFLAGGDEAAIALVGRRYLDPSAEIRRIRDTHFRSSTDFDRYKPQSYQLMEETGTEFLRRGGRIEVVTGLSVDRAYIEMLDRAERQAAAEPDAQVHAVKWHQLDTSAPAMSFTILESRDDRKSEVYFGWLFDGVLAGTVFGSRDVRLVKEFSGLFDRMVRAATDTTARRILDEAGGGARVGSKQEWSRLWDLMEGIERGDAGSEADLRLATTGFVNQTGIVQICRRLLKKGVRIQIIMMNPDNAVLLDARFGVRGQSLAGDGLSPEQGRLDIVRQLDVFKRLSVAHRRQERQDEPQGRPGGSLEVYTSDRQPVGFYALTDRWVMFGMMPVTGSFLTGPVLEAGSGSDLWRLLREDWEERLKDARRRQESDPAGTDPASGVK
jgi:hypothetical protein